MRMNIIFFSFVAFLLKGHIAKVDEKKSFSKLFDPDLVNNYEKLFKVIKCQYCLKQKKGAESEKCSKIIEECKNLLKDGEYDTVLKDLMNDVKVDNNEKVYGPNTDELKKIVNFLETHMKEVDVLKGIIDDIKENKDVVLVNGGNNPTMHKLNAKMKSLKNSVQYIQNSHDTINEQLSKSEDETNDNMIPDMFQLIGNGNKDTNENIQLGNTCDKEDAQKNELIDIGIDEFVKNSMKDLFKDGEGFMDVVKSALIQDAGGLGGELASLIEKGKEIGDKIADIEGHIDDKKGKETTETLTVEKLDHFKTELSSYEYLLITLKGIALSKLKSILIKLLYKAYIVYRAKKAKEFGENPPTIVAEEHYLSELKKGVLELGMKILFNKLKTLLSIVKKKIYKKIEKRKNAKKEKNVKAEDETIIANTLNGESDELTSPMLRGSIPAEDISLMSSIDSLLEEIDFYEKEMYDNPESAEPLHGEQKNEEAPIQGMDDQPTEDETQTEEIQTEEIQTEELPKEEAPAVIEETESTKETEAETGEDSNVPNVDESEGVTKQDGTEVVEQGVEQVTDEKNDGIPGENVVTDVTEQAVEMEKVVEQVVQDAEKVVQDIANVVEEVAEVVKEASQIDGEVSIGEGVAQAVETVTDVVNEATQMSDEGPNVEEKPQE
ncbi:merozoite surface protein-9 precursor [Plasmodium gonderi]|uniref:Merozoite surface protein 9 n=1 Tax=Plasmodium gonderi TaxID=77519 RepID=U3PSC9_PLAGO|nr:merozoite surface protein-9 precursor [Plasmodium gonderi]AGW51288.1 merozoite surface protein 9 [Plasmodium gonderi]GAW83662.1 merozoite surface protein-9 precursor [Plasmodium gonderi]